MERMFKTIVNKRYENKAVVTELMVVSKESHYLSDVSDILNNLLIKYLRKHRLGEFETVDFLHKHAVTRKTEEEELHIRIDVNSFKFLGKRASKRLKGFLEEINGKKVLKELYRSLYAKKQQIYILPLGEIEDIKINEVIDKYELRKESENIIEIIQ